MKGYIFLLIHFIAYYLTTPIVLAQHKVVDSLSKVLKTQHIADTTKVHSLVALSYAYYRIDADSAIFFGMEAKKIAERLNYSIGIAMSLRQISVGYWVKGEYNKTIELAQTALEIFNQNKYYEGVSNCYNSIGLVYYRKKEYKKALNYFEEGLSIDKKYRYEKNKAIKLTNIGIIYEAQKEYGKALSYFNQSLEICKKIKFNQFVAVTTNHIGKTYLRLKEYDKAELFAKMTLKIAKELGSDRELTLGYLLLGQIHIEKKKFREAETFLLQSFVFAMKNKELEHDKEVAEALYLIYKIQKNDTKALKYHELFKVYQDCLASEKVAKEVRNLEYSYQLKLREKEIDLLKKDNLLQEENSNKQQLSLLTLSIILLISIFVGLFLMRNHKKLVVFNALILSKNNEVSAQREQLETQAEKLQKANELKNKLFSIISHDLRSPLNTLQGVLELISVGAFEPEEMTEIYANINKQLKALQDTLANLLQWAKSQMNNDVINPELFDIHIVITEKQELLQATASTKEITIHNKVPKNTQVYADINQIRLVLRNLIANAIKFTRRGGEITIEATQKEATIEISVKDNGVGMSEETCNKLFKIETHFSSTGVEGERGNGLGLLLVKDCIEKSGGTISVQSELNVGTVFIINLPTTKNNLE